MNYRKNDRWPSYRFYSALQRQKSPMRYICEIFGAPRFSSFSTQSALNGHGRYVPHPLAEIGSASGHLLSSAQAVAVAQPCRSPVTRQITSPTSSATRTEPSGPSVTPTGRPEDTRSSGARNPDRVSRGG